MKKTLTSLLIILMVASLIFAAHDVRRPMSLQKTQSYTDVWMNVNRMHGVLRNNGTWFYNTLSPNDGGLWWPRGTTNMVIYGAGQMVGSLVNGDPRIAGVIHDATEFQPGLILEPGLDPPVGDNRLDSRYHWYWLKSDGTGDWDNWPVDQGAPVDADGKPLLIGDQTIFSVFNDAGEHTLFSTPKLGLEIRQLVWAFDRADAIGDMIFIKWTLINKSPYDWDETYFVIWSDPDIGDGWDDFVGCDTTRGLGYAYNADNDDVNYGAAAPACGVDFFQGPIIDEPGSTVELPDGTVLQDKRMLKMTSFIYYNNDDSNQGNPQTGQDIWNYMRGFWRDGSPITYGGVGTDPTAARTRFMFSGDPETGTGWNDRATSDRRFMMSTGPYRMEKWQDTNGNNQPDFGEPGVQEIVAGVLVGRGTNNFNSVSYLKAMDEIAQLAYDLNFALPKAPKAPAVQVSQLPNEVILTWNDRSEYMDDGVAPYSVEDIVANGLVGQYLVVDGEYIEVTDGTYDFTGYTVYQFSDASGRDPVLYEKFGVDKVADATPYTDPRYIIVTDNKHPQVGQIGDPLINGKAYYFGIQARSYCKFAIPQDFPSSMSIVTVVPQYSPGVRYTVTNGDTLSVSKNGLSDGRVVVEVIDPSQVTGDYYKVVFTADQTWHLLRSADSLFTTADTLLRNQGNQRGDDAYNVVDGLLVKVFGAPNDFLGFIVTANAGGVLDPPDAAAAGWGNPAANFPVHNERGSASDRPSDDQQVGAAKWLVHTGEVGDDANAGFDFFKYRVTQGGARWPLIIPNDFEIRFTETGGIGFEPLAFITGADAGGKIIQVPFELWNIRDPNNPDDDYRMFPYLIDIDENGQFNLLKQADLDALGYGDTADHQVSGGSNDPYTDWIYWVDPEDTSPGQAGYDAIVSAIQANPDTYEYYGLAGGDILRRMVLVNWNGGDVAAGEYNADMPETGTIFRIQTTKPNTPGVSYNFQAPEVAVTQVTQKEDLKKVKVVPNPYYGYHSGEMDPFNRWVQFTYLPNTCTIRIFDIVGQMVRKLEKDDAATLMQWDLKNAYGLPVASGIYVYHVEAPGLGDKVGKIAVFTPNERLDAY
ncbi:hypothetical protein JXO59_13115 [candidate division KSB1 bacterium]|nr:hypothetical protein [candidate division KSB1 bacterium]